MGSSGSRGESDAQNFRQGDHLGRTCSGRSRGCPACIEKQNGPLPRSELRCHLPVSRRKDTSIGSTIRHLEGGVHCPESSKAPKSCADSTRRKKTNTPTSTGIQDSKMEVLYRLYHIKPYFVGIFPYIGLKNRPNIYGRYLQFTLW